jgi:hypothetical protein
MNSHSVPSRTCTAKHQCVPGYEHHTYPYTVRSWRWETKPGLNCHAWFFECTIARELPRLRQIEKNQVYYSHATTNCFVRLDSENSQCKDSSYYSTCKCPQQCIRHKKASCATVDLQRLTAMDHLFQWHAVTVQIRCNRSHYSLLHPITHEKHANTCRSVHRSNPVNGAVHMRQLS